MATRHRRYSCESAAETLEWMNAIDEFLRPYRPIMDAHVVNFFKDKLWEMVDEQWMDCLKKESVESLLKLPSGFVQDYWPSSLQEFIHTLRSLVIPREPKLAHPIIQDLHVSSLGTVLAQGMNMKKKHEVEILAAVVSMIARGSRAETVIDVGSGQGYLAQVLSFQYQLPVIAIDASLHHATVTSSRAERIKKHYAAKCAVNQHLKVPQTITCRVLSSEALTDLTTTVLREDSNKQSLKTENGLELNALHKKELNAREGKCFSNKQHTGPPLVLAGLHACGDLSVNMLRTFVECERVTALVSIGCCYNLLSEDCVEVVNNSSSFPMSSAAKLSRLYLGKRTRDLACQSAERWRGLTKDIALQTFDVHSYRAALQMVLEKNFPEILQSSPSVGRQGKALRRQRFRRVLESRLGTEMNNSSQYSTSNEQWMVKDCSLPMKPNEVEPIVGCCDHVVSTDVSCTSSEVLSNSMFTSALRCQENSVGNSDKYLLFKEFSNSALCRLGCGTLQDPDLLEIWKDVLPFTELIGPFWSLRAALGPVVETYILLDRLLFLQEQGNSLEAFLFPLFDPMLSPRNVAIIARKSGADSVKSVISSCDIGHLELELAT
ncbi:uncharacterized protein [Typha latifolia]|uniref:uncharacterized protein isoform X2 n=1 Tax=Typha latifolia TaxID=4733 RepID=UPI003C30E582